MIWHDLAWYTCQYHLKYMLVSSQVHDLPWYTLACMAGQELYALAWQVNCKDTVKTHWHTMLVSSQVHTISQQHTMVSRT